LATISLHPYGADRQITYHLNRAMDNGLAAGEASEAVAHLAFYAG
jgi:4-carboxymuconolactone decarboxylase